jgi:hypothetical protein
LTVSHCDPETLALRSLGERVGTPEDEAHLATCQACQDELASLGELVGVARSHGPVEMAQPGPEVWPRIQHELGLDSAPARPAHGHQSARPSQPAASESAPPDLEPGDAPVVSLHERRERRARPATWLLAAAGVGGIVLGGVVTAAVVGSQSQESLTVAASVDLAPLPAWDAQGTAELAVNEDGQQVLVVSLDAASATSADGYQEVWLIDENVEGMVSLGVLEGSNAQFVIPAGVDVGAFPIVDISLEPFDGDPTHSGDSIARGQIEA